MLVCESPGQREWTEPGLWNCISVAVYACPHWLCRRLPNKHKQVLQSWPCHAEMLLHKTVSFAPKGRMSVEGMINLRELWAPKPSFLWCQAPVLCNIKLKIEV